MAGKMRGNQKVQKMQVAHDLPAEPASKFSFENQERVHQTAETSKTVGASATAHGSPVDPARMPVKAKWDATIWKLPIEMMSQRPQHDPAANEDLSDNDTAPASPVKEREISFDPLLHARNVQVHSH
jgi:hypothetical protein